MQLSNRDAVSDETSATKKRARVIDEMFLQSCLESRSCQTHQDTRTKSSHRSLGRFDGNWQEQQGRPWVQRIVEPRSVRRCVWRVLVCIGVRVWRLELPMCVSCRRVRRACRVFVWLYICVAGVARVAGVNVRVRVHRCGCEPTCVTLCMRIRLCVCLSGGRVVCVYVCRCCV